MKRYSTTLLLLLIVALTIGAQKAKYVFLFIGDGMGVNPVHMTEIYNASVEGKIGIKPLLFTTFPAATMASTYSANSDITDSSASGTAIACGTKTNNGCLGMGPNGERLESVAEMAKKAGKKVAILTTVSIDHATPGAFYAHQPSRSMYYEICEDLVKSDFDFFGGSGFLRPDKEGKPNIYTLFKDNGYTVAKGMQEYKDKRDEAQKMILRNYTRMPQNELKHAIDQKPGDLNLTELTESALDFLTKDKKGDKGFFMMVEGGIIDHATHQNDSRTAIEDIKDMDKAIAVAYEFYKKHPKETLIVVTSDHDTGGLGLSVQNNYTLRLDRLQYQKQSQNALSEAIKQLGKDKKGNVSWDDVKNLLREKMGFWDKINLSWDQEKRLFEEYGNIFINHSEKEEETLYAKSSALASMAKIIMNERAHIGWTTFSHTGGYVPVFAIGAGSDQFTHQLENSDIHHLIKKAAGYK